MAISFVGSTSDGTLPAGVVADDQLLLIVQHDSAVSTPSGWTLVASVTQSSRLYVFRRTATGSGDTPTLTVDIKFIYRDVTRAS